MIHIGRLSLAERLVELKAVESARAACSSRHPEATKACPGRSGRVRVLSEESDLEAGVVGPGARRRGRRWVQRAQVPRKVTVRVRPLSVKSAARPNRGQAMDSVGYRRGRNRA